MPLSFSVILGRGPPTQGSSSQSDGQTFFSIMPMVLLEFRLLLEEHAEADDRRVDEKTAGDRHNQGADGNHV